MSEPSQNIAQNPHDREDRSAVSRRAFLAKMAAAGALGSASLAVGASVMQVPRAFGVVGDVEPAAYIVYIDSGTTYARNGTTGAVDYSGTAQSVLQNVLNALTNGGSIFIRAGTYGISSTITIPSTYNLTVEGEGSATIIVMTGNNPVFSSNAGTLWTVRRLQIQGGGSSNSNAHGFQLTDPTDCKLEDIYLLNCRNAIDVTTAWHLALTNLTIGNEGTGPQNYFGIYSHDPAQGAGDNTAITANGVNIAKTVSDGIHLEHVSGSKWVNCEVNSAGGHGVFVGLPATTHYPTHFSHWANCLSDSNTMDAWHIDGSGSQNGIATDMQFANIAAGNSRVGLYLKNVGNIVISNPLMKTFTQHAIEIDTTSTGSSFHVVINGGYVDGYDSAGSGRYAGVYVNAAVKNAVIGTHFVGNGTIGSVYETSGSDYNIYSLLDYNGDEALHSVGPNNVVANNRN